MPRKQQPQQSNDSAPSWLLQFLQSQEDHRRQQEEERRQQEELRRQEEEARRREDFERFEQAILTVSRNNALSSTETNNSNAS